MKSDRKSAIVTGSGGGGSARVIALRLAREGFAVAVSDGVDGGGEGTVQLVRGAGGRAAWCHADVAKEDEVRRLVAFAERELGPLGVLVNNASDLAFEPG